MTEPAERPADLIPHRPPILFLDSIQAVDEGAAVTERVVRDGDWWLEDGEAAEGALLEGLAQTAAVLCGRYERARGAEPSLGLLVGLRKVAIERRPRVGERLRFAVELIRRLPPLVLIRGEARAGDEVIARGELKFYLEEQG